MLKAVIFDFDGTIIDTESLWFQIYKEVLADEHKIELTLEEFAQCIGTKDDVLYDFINTQTTNPVNRVDIETKVKEKVNLLKETLILRDGVYNLINEAKRLGLKVGIASSSNRSWIDEFLTKFNLHQFFDVIKTSEDVENVKPDPALYIKAVESLGIKPNEALAIEDSVNGSLAAVQAGLKCLVIPNQVTSFLAFPKEVSLYDDFSLLKIESLLE